MDQTIHVMKSWWLNVEIGRVATTLIKMARNVFGCPKIDLAMFLFGNTLYLWFLSAENTMNSVSSFWEPAINTIGQKRKKMRQNKPVYEMTRCRISQLPNFSTKTVTEHRNSMCQCSHCMLHKVFESRNVPIKDHVVSFCSLTKFQLGKRVRNFWGKMDGLKLENPPAQALDS